MISKAHSKYIRISAKKARLVADIIRGKRVDEAFSLLPTVNKKMSEYALDVLKSAYSNAKNKYPQANYDESGLYISKVIVDEGPALRRYRAASMGRASAIKKRTSHVLIELDLVPAQMQQEQVKNSSKKAVSKIKKEAKAVKAPKKTTVKKDDSKTLKKKVSEQKVSEKKDK